MVNFYCLFLTFYLILTRSMGKKGKNHLFLMPQSFLENEKRGPR